LNLLEGFLGRLEANMDDNKKQGTTAPTPGSIAMPNVKKRGLKGFFRDVQREMKLVQWATPREGFRLTTVVLAVCAIVTAILTLLSYVADTLFRVVFRGGV